MFVSKEMLHFIITKSQVCVVLKGKLVLAKFACAPMTGMNSIDHLSIFQNVTRLPVFVHVTPKKKVISRPRFPIWVEQVYVTFLSNGKTQPIPDASIQKIMVASVGVLGIRYIMKIDGVIALPNALQVNELKDGIAARNDFN